MNKIFRLENEMSKDHSLLRYDKVIDVNKFWVADNEKIIVEN